MYPHAQTTSLAVGSSDRIRGLDTLRFFLAMWVVFSHNVAPPLTAGYDVGNWWLRKVNAAYLWSINGQAAVIMFFVLSGFCIHYPYRNRDRIGIAGFYVNRGIRIGLPLVAALLVGWAAGYKRWGDAEAVPIWSLYAELTYYLVYPGVLYLRSRIGTLSLVIGAYAVSAVAFVAWGWREGYYQEYGGPFYICSTLVGLPVWLLGVWLAEGMRHSSPKPLVMPRIWRWRLGAYLLSAPIFPLSYMHIIGTGPTLNLFAIYAVFWLAAEIRYWHHRPPVAGWEFLGLASYSIYLLHGMFLFAVAALVPFAGYVADWAVRLAVVVAGSLAFYFLVERPSHRLARMAKRQRAQDPTHTVRNVAESKAAATAA